MRRTTLICAGAIALVTLVGCGDSDDTTTPSDEGGGPADLVVGALDKLEFDSGSYEADSGELEVLYRNDGSLPHTLLIEGVDGFKLSVGDEDSGTVTLEPGSYVLYCDVAGHQSAGMEAELTVT